MKRFFSLALLTSLALLGGCDQVQGAIDRFVTPSTATLNGYTVERDPSGAPTGNVDLNVSALDADDEPIAGNISNPVVTVSRVTTPGGISAAQAYSATAEIKFDIRVQEIINAVLDIDQSGSMKKTDPERKRVDAAESFIGRITAQDRLAVMAFRGEDEGLRASSLLQDFTSDQTALGAAVAKVKQNTDTPIWDSVLDTLDLHDGDEGGVASASRVVVLFTDGQRNGGDTDFAGALSVARESGVKFFTVGLGAGRKQIDLTELQTLAEATGGTFANVADADGLEALFAKIFNAIRASGVITVNISPVPPAGSLVTGTIEFDVNGETFKLPYAVQL